MPREAGGGDDRADRERLKVKQTTPLSEAVSPLDTALAVFVNQYDGTCYVTVAYAYGGASSYVLENLGDYVRVACRTSAPYDAYCYNLDGECKPNGTLAAVGGQTYNVG